MHCHSVSCDVTWTRWLIGCDGNDNQFHQQKVLMCQDAFHDLLEVATHTITLLCFFSLPRSWAIHFDMCLCLQGSSPVSSGAAGPTCMSYDKTETSGCLFCYKIKIYCASLSWRSTPFGIDCHGILHFDLLSTDSILLRLHY